MWVLEKATVELAVMGVLKDYHRSGIGRQLVERAKEAARLQGYEFVQVKTVKMGMYEDYERTNLFYISCDFKELEVFPLLWDEADPCQIYVMSLKVINSSLIMLRNEYWYLPFGSYERDLVAAFL